MTEANLKNEKTRKGGQESSNPGNSRRDPGGAADICPKKLSGVQKATKMSQVKK